MKKLAAVLISAIMVISSVGCVNGAKMNETSIKMPNPFVECKTIEEAENVVGYKIIEAENIPKGYELSKIFAIENELVDFRYMNGKKELVFRQGKGKKDVSGDYNKYEEVKKEKISGLEVETRGEKGKIKVANWTIGDFTFSIGSDGLTSEEIKLIVSSVKEKEAKLVKLPNPFIECQTIEEAEEIVGYKVVEPKDLPEGYTRDKILAMKYGLVEIIYVNGENQIIYRQGKGKDDISGDYNKYEEVKKVKIGGLDVETRGEKGKIKVANWTIGEYTFSIGSKGLTIEELEKIILSIRLEDTEKQIGLPNPFVEVKTMEEAEKLAKYSFKVPNEIDGGYKKQSIEVINNDLIQVIYRNGDREILIRKAKYKGDISGDYNIYPNNIVIKVDNRDISMRGDQGKINTATWTDGDFSYSITAELGGVGIDKALVEAMVKDIS